MSSLISSRSNTSPAPTRDERAVSLRVPQRLRSPVRSSVSSLCRRPPNQRIDFYKEGCLLCELQVGLFFLPAAVWSLWTGEDFSIGSLIPEPWDPGPVPALALAA